MWFKNALIYPLAEPFTLTPEALHDALSQDQARHCGKLEKQTLGWVSPLGSEHVNLTHALQGCIMLCLRKQQRLLPNSVVKQHTLQKVAEIETAEHRQVSTREKRQIGDELAITLLPQAFTTDSDLFAYIDTRLNWLIIDTSSANKAEELTVLLRQSLGSLKLMPLAVNQDCHAMMTRWVQETAIDAGWYIDDACELIDPRAETTQIKCVNQDLGVAEVQGHIQSGKIVSKLAMNWQDRMAFTLDKSLNLKKIKFLDLVHEQQSELDIEDKIQQFEVDFAIMAEEFYQCIPALLELLGGLKTPASAHATAVTA